MFNELKKRVLGDFDVKMNISMKNETISVSFVPILKAGSKASQLKPIIISGSADDLDAEFLQVIGQTFIESSQLVYDVQAFTKSLEKVKSETEKEAKKEVKKADEPAKTAAKSKTKTKAKPEPAKTPELIAPKTEAPAPVEQISAPAPNLSAPVESVSAPVQEISTPVQQSVSMDDFGSVDDLLNGLDI